MRQHAYVGGGASNVDDHGVLLLRQERRAADGVRRPARDGEDGVTLRVVHAHERAVVLAQVHGHVGKALRRERRLEAVGRRARHVVQRRVQDGRVLALEEAERPDLRRQRDGEALAQLLAQNGGGALLVRVGHRREHAGHSNGLEALFAHDARDLADLVFRQRADLATVELVAAVHEEVAHAHGVLQLVGPVGHAADGRRGRGAHAQRGNLVQALALDDGVRAVRGAQHGEPDVARRVGTDLGDHLVHGGHDAAHDVLGGGAFRRGHQLEVAVDDHRVGVRAAHVDTQTPDALLICHYACTSSLFIAATRCSTGT